MRESLCFVQFLHPGGEHRPDVGNLKQWNTGKHRRKFIISSGKAIRRDQETESEIVFWGEWEADSEVVVHFQNQADGEPEYLWRPFYGVPESYSRLQNTDPFVFGSFLYGICQQYRSTGPTQLRYLAPGSVILFGSCLNDQFVLDTVFVVRDWIDHTRSNFRQVLDGRVPNQYIDVTIKPLYESGRKEQDVPALLMPTDPGGCTAAPRLTIRLMACLVSFLACPLPIRVLAFHGRRFVTTE